MFWVLCNLWNRRTFAPSHLTIIELITFTELNSAIISY